MRYWLLKTEPEEWSWLDQINSKNKISEWNGVRNFQARNNLKKMKKKDLCFFYHTGEEKKIVGIVEVAKEYFKDKKDKSGNFVSIKVRTKNKLKNPVALKEIKKKVFFNQFSLVKQSRLSVIEVDIKYWKKIYKMSNIIQKN